MDKKLKAIVDGLDDEQRKRIEARDALLASFRVSVADIEVTGWQPQLPPELAQAKRRRRKKR